MKIVCIIQARMGSKRCPGKVMREIGGKPLVGYLLDRVALFRHLVDDVIVAIPAVDAGSSLEKYLRQYKWLTVYSGAEENDVAGRFAEALRTGSWDYFIRLCADSPLLDVEMMEYSINSFFSNPFLQQDPALIFSNVGYGFYPSGQQFEIINTLGFLEREPDMRGMDREHVTTFLHREAAFLPMVVDTEEDFERIKNLIGKMDRPVETYGLLECQEILKNLRPQYLV